MKRSLVKAAALGSLSAALALSWTAARAAETVYIPLGGADEVLVVDAARGAPERRIGGLPAVHGLAATPDGAYLVAGSFLEETRDAAAVPDKPEGMPEDEHAAHHAKPAPTESLQSNAVSFVSVVRASDGDVLRRIEVPGAVHHVAVAPNGAFAVTTHSNGGGISLIDLASMELVATVQTGPLPNYAVIGPGSDRIYVSNAGNGTISEIDVRRRIVLRNFLAGAGPEHLALSHDGRRIYAADAEAGRVIELSAESGTVLRTFDVGGLLHGLDLSSDGRELFVSARERGKVVAISLHAPEMREAPLAPEPYHLAAVNGDALYISSAAESKIWIVDPDTLSLRGEIAIEAEGHQMAVVQR
jgi:DNA-binding beta-propeller fold protein YncE